MIEPIPDPGISGRLLAASCYFGMAPVARLCRCLSGPFLRHHYAQAMAVLFLVQVLLLLVVLVTVASTFVSVTDPDVARHFEEWMTLDLLVLEYASWLLIGGGAILWAFLLALALAGSHWPVPLLGRLARRQALVRLSFAGNCLALLLIALTTALARHATSITRTNGEGGAVYLLYDDAIPVPRWAYALGLYRISLLAEQQWGADSVVLDRLDADTLRTALANAKVVIFASHGSGGDIGTPALRVAPPPLGAMDEREGISFLVISRPGAESTPITERVYPSPKLRLVYVSACDAGLKAAEWKEHLSPADVITFHRLASPLEHLWWLVTAAPASIEKLELGDSSKRRR
jgi:hypothetical protein